MILTATVALLATRTANSAVVMRLIAGTRFAPELRNMVGTCVQLGLCVVDLRGVSFWELIGRTWAATVLAHRHSHYPSPLVIPRLRDVSRVA